MRMVAKTKKANSQRINKDKEGFLGLSMLGLSGFRICDICVKKSAPILFKQKRVKKAVLV